MNFVNVIIVLASIQFLYFIFMVKNARKKYGVLEPSTSGHPMFERYYHVQTDTLEKMMIFIPILFLTPIFLNSLYVTFIGSFFIIGRTIYYRQFIKDTSKTSYGFVLTIAPIIILLSICVFGLLKVFILKLL